VALIQIGHTYRNLADYPKALDSYQQALAIARETGEIIGEGWVLEGMGNTYYAQGDKEKAVSFYQQALAIWQKVPERPEGKGTLNNLAATYQELKQYPEALATYEQILSLDRKQGDRKGEGLTLWRIGQVYQESEQYAGAIGAYEQSLKIYRELGEHKAERNILATLAEIYQKQGDKGKAQEYQQQAQAISKELGDAPSPQSSQAQKLFDEGMQLFQQGTAESLQQAIAKWEAALPLWRKLGDKAQEAFINLALGRVYDLLGFKPKALEYYNQALPIYRAVGDRAGEATTLNNIGRVYDALGEKQQALDYYQQALPLRKAVGDRAGEAVTLDNLGYLLASQNQPQLAIVFYKQSVNLYESLRGEIKGLSQEIQQSYTKTVEDTYRRLADVLLSQDRILEAQRVLDLLKVQELDDYLRGVRGTGQQLSFFRPEEEILKKYNELQKSAIQLGEELSSLRKIPESNRNSAQNQRIDQLVQLQKALNQQFNDFTDSPEIVALVDQLSRTAKKQSIDLADLDALRENLQELNAALLYPLILDDRLELIITTPNSPPLRRSFPVKKSELNQVILQFRQALQNPGSDAKTPAQKLYNWLIAPLEADLKAAQVKTIIYAPDGQLRYIPLAALYDGQQWLVQRYGINNITAKSFTELNAQPKNGSTRCVMLMYRELQKMEYGTTAYRITKSAWCRSRMEPKFWARIDIRCGDRCSIRSLSKLSRSESSSSSKSFLFSARFAFGKETSLLESK
jgi:tetratricopeptide (TPR) repeat protein